MFKNYRFFIVAVLLAFLGMIFYPVAILPIKDAVGRVVYPLANGLTGVSDATQGFFANLKAIKGLVRENQSLKDENIGLRSELDSLKEIQHENDILREELGFAREKQQQKLISAQIIARSPSSFMQSFKVSKGSSDGVVQGAPVISHGYLIGVTANVSTNFCDVILITNSSSLIPVVLQESRGMGLLQGGLQGLVVREISLENKITTGEKVLTSGLGGDLPNGLPVGVVEKVISQESEIFQKVSISSPINFSRLEVIFILIK